MATLPDLDTSNVSLMAYYNIIDSNDVSEIDSDSALTYPNLDSYTLYDNGWEGVISTQIGTDINIRVKNDGWVVVYFDRVENYGVLVNDPASLEGLGALTGWNPADQDATNNNFTDAIGGICDELDASANIFYSGGDESIYSYSNPDATNIGVYAEGGGGNYDVHDISFSEGTTVHDMAVTGYCKDGVNPHLIWDNTDLYGGNEHSMLHLDTIDTSVTHTLEVRDIENDSYATVVVLYS